MDIDVRDPAMEEVVSPSAELESLATGFGFTEGPIWHGVGSYLVFSDIPNSTMYRWSGDGPAEVFRKPSNMANGNVFDDQWRLLTCEHETSRLTRTELDGSITVLADRYRGKELNSPNDVVVTTDGSIYFSDPTFGRAEFYGVPREAAQDFRGVYRLGPGSEEPVLLLDDFDQPNGLCFSPDERLFYVDDTARSHIRVFTVGADGSLTGGEVFAEPSGAEDGLPDGLKTDVEGRVYCTGPGGIHVFSPGGKCLGVIRVPEVAANFTWGGADRTQMFITASTSLYRIATQVPGNVR
jgi:gluconolactonase